MGTHGHQWLFNANSIDFLLPLIAMNCVINGFQKKQIEPLVPTGGFQGRKDHMATSHDGLRNSPLFRLSLQIDRKTPLDPEPDVFQER